MSNNSLRPELLQKLGQVVRNEEVKRVCLVSNLIPPSKRASESVKPALCMCASIILKLNNQKINLVQSVVSLILKAGHATTATCAQTASTGNSWPVDID